MDRREVDISLITKSVKKAYNKDMIDFHSHYRLTTRNGYPGIRWDFINTNIEENFTNFGKSRTKGLDKFLSMFQSLACEFHNIIYLYKY